MRTTPLAVFGLLLSMLVGCHSVPDVTYVPVPSGAPVLHGAYAGTLREAQWFEDAVLSADGKHLYVTARVSSHTTILDLDPDTGRELRRANVPIAAPSGLAQRADGNLIIAGWYGSGVVDPSELKLKAKLPPAGKVSQDGKLLLAPMTANDHLYRLYSTATGQLASQFDSPEFGLWTSSDLTWAADRMGKTVINLKTGKTLSVAGNRVDRCKPANTFGLPFVQAVEGVPAGFLLVFTDGSLEWHSTDGRLISQQTFPFKCPTDQYSTIVSQIRTRSFGPAVLFQGSFNDGNRVTTAFGDMLTDRAPVVRLENPKTTSYFSNWFSGMFAFHDASKPLFPGNETMERWTVWKASLPDATFPVSLQAVATYRDEASYDLQGILTTPAGSLEFTGEGLSSQASGTPRIVFKPQAVCGIPPFAAPCPSVSWKATFTGSGQDGGQMYGGADDVLTGPKAQQRGSMQFQWNGEQRDFTFTLNAKQ